MKRYLLFVGYNYYPSGGWDDFVNSYDTVEEAMLAVNDKETPYFKQDAFLSYPKTIGNVDWWHVIDTTTGEEVA